MTWIFHFPESRQVSLRCLNNKWATLTETLSEVGLITNVKGCSISTSEIRNLPELYGAFQTTFDTPHMYVPDKIQITDHEVRLLEETAPVKQLDAVKSQDMASQRTLDGDSLLHAHYTFLHRERHSYWHLIITTTLCTAAIIGIICLSLRSYLARRFLRCFPKHTHSNLNTENRTLTSSTTGSNPAAVEPTNDDLQRNVTFTKYYLRQTEQ